MRFFALLFWSVLSSAQMSQFSVAGIPTELKENSNAVVRQEQIEIRIPSRGHIEIKTMRAVTVLNEFGMKCIGAFENRNVKSVDATIFDANGNKIKDIRRKDFKEVSASESFITDDKITYLEYTPVSYPFTIVYNSTVSDGNTAFIPSWLPVTNYFCSVQSASLSIEVAPELGLRHKVVGFENYRMETAATGSKTTLMVNDIPAVKSEQYSPSFSDLAPKVVFGLEKFRLEGVDGEATSWESFSKWMYSNLLDGTDVLPEETKAKVKSLVGKETDPLKKARLVYQYVQNKTRYVSIQLGIGGWRPMKATDVDRLGYGDCKALTNYTRALLEVVGVPSFYTVVYGDSDKRDLMADFVSMQGNHIILGIPHAESICWIECTSQTMPFGFLGDFTDDRLVLPIKQEGSGLVRTVAYTNEFNRQDSKGNCVLDVNGDITGSVQIVSTGIQYDRKASLEQKSPNDLVSFYKEYFNAIPNAKFTSAQVNNDKEHMTFTETVSLQGERYGTLSGEKIIFPINAFNSYQAVPQRYRARSHPVQVSRGFYDVDEIRIEIPLGYMIEAKPDKQEINSKFGHYLIEVNPVSENVFLVRRSLKINEGKFSKDDYESFRKFSEQIARADSSKMVIVKI